MFSKSYLDLAAHVTPPVCILAYGIGGLVGCVFLYKYLPETEGKTLADVEKYFTYGKQTTSDKCTDIRNGDVP